MSSLQVLQNKATKVILNRPLYSSSTEALAILKWLPLEKRRFQRCVHVYKCINGLINHDMDLIRQDVLQTCQKKLGKAKNTISCHFRF